MSDSDKVQFLSLPTREAIEVFVENGRVKILQPDLQHGDQEIWLTAQDARRVGDALKEAAVHLKSKVAW